MKYPVIFLIFYTIFTIISLYLANKILNDDRVIVVASNVCQEGNI